MIVLLLNGISAVGSREIGFGVDCGTHFVGAFNK